MSESAGAKPPAFPVRMMFQGSKLAGDHLLNSNSFLSELSTQSDSVSSDAKASRASTQDVKLDNAVKSFSSMREMSYIYQSIGSLLPHQDVVQMELMEKHQKANDQREDLKQGLNVRDLIVQELQKKNAMAVQQARLAFSDDDEEELDEEQIEELLATAGMSLGESAAPHDVNLYSGKANVFKKGSQENHQFFEDSEALNILAKQSMSPKRVMEELNPGHWEKVVQSYDEIRNFRLDFAMELDGFDDSVDSHNRFDLNIEDINDPYKNNGIDRFDMLANNHDILSAEFQDRFSAEQSHAFINHSWETGMRMTDALRSAFGSENDIDPKLLTLSADELDDDPGAQKKFDEMMASFKDIISNLKLPQILHWQVLLKSFKPVQDQLDLENVVKTISGDNKAAQSKQKMVSDYVAHINKTVLDPHITPKPVFNDHNVDFGSKHQLQSSFQYLSTKGILDKTGAMNASVDPNDPSFDFSDFPGDEKLSADVLTELKRMAGERFDVRSMDTSKVNGKSREAIKFIGADGASRSFTELFDLINKEGSADEIIENTALAYDQLIEMHGAMTGATLENGDVTGELQFTELSDGSVEINLSDKASWSEWQDPADKDSAGSYVRKVGQAFKMRFSSLEEAKAFKKKIRQSIAAIEPLLGTFKPQNVQFKMLVDNSLALGKEKVHQEGHENYKLRLDTGYSKAFVDSAFYKKLDTEVLTAVATVFVKENVGLMVVNKAIKSQWQMQVDRYRETKEDIKADEKKQFMREARSLANKMQEQKRQERMAEARRRQFQQSILAADRKKAAASQAKRRK